MTSSQLPSGVPFRFPWKAAVAVGVAVLALAGIALLTVAIYSALGGFNSPPAPTATRLAIVPSTPVILPTVTLPPPTATTLPPTETPAVASTATMEALPSAVALVIVKPANVRSGPGFGYPVIGGLEKGAAPKLLGRSTDGDWFVIAYAASGGQGWVSVLVVDYSGDLAALPVITAPPTPLPSKTSPPPPTTVSPPPVIGSHGLTGQLALCVVKPSYAAKLERICFRETLKNNTANMVTYGLLGVHAANLSGGPSLFHTSWRGDLGIGPGCIGPTDRCGGSWEDGMFIDVPGTYRLTLQICYSNEKTCQGSSGEWETLTPGIDIVVVNWTP